MPAKSDNRRTDQLRLHAQVCSIPWQRARSESYQSRCVEPSKVWRLSGFTKYFTRKSCKAAQAPENVAPEPIAQISVGTSAKGAATQCGKKAKQEGDFAIVGLICSTGMRPFSVAALKREHFIASDTYIFEITKGAGYLKAAL